MSEPRRFTLQREQMFDLQKTGRLAELFMVPREQRTAAWIDAFFDAVWHASLEIPESPFFQGPDTFTYLRMHVPSPGKPFQSNSLSNVGSFAVERGAGVAIFASPEAPEPEFVLSMGRVDSLLRYDSWRGDPVDLEEVAAKAAAQTKDEHGMETFTAQRGMEVMVGSPNTTLLPPHTAGMLHRHLAEGWRMSDPRIALMIVPDMAPSRNLVLGRKLSEFPDAVTAARQTQSLLWYLPPSRSLVLMPESWTLDQMRPLTEFFKKIEVGPTAT
ncbi:hypothetical protein [Terriglobus aquaticus]|uniref:Uncharacterized protein n=1 Tax=Terriglobus aquaticus TaxID=940139 RepID=A0ABW9KIA6_9BACT|nr:hypothetical protein [Terriglobus aquaticus]